MATPDRDGLANGLVSIGEDAIAKTNDALLDDYYTDDYKLHSPAGTFNRAEIKAYFAALRESFTDFTISRAQILVDGNYVSSRTVMAGRFDKEFAYTPIGTVEPNGQHVQWELINIFRYTDEGRLVEEWVQTDTYDFLRQLGAVGADDGRAPASSPPPDRRVPLAEARRGASGPQQRHGGPAVAGDDRAVRTEAFAERLELLRGRRRVDVPGEGVALPDAEVVDRPDVEASQLEHQVHLGCPAADPAHGDQPLDQLLVASSRRAAEDDGAVEHLRGEVAERGELVRRQARGPERGVGGGVQRLRRQRVADGCAHPPVDRLGGAAGELLEDDRAHERGERPVRVARPVADRADAGDEVGEHGVARRDLVDRRPERALCR